MMRLILAVFLINSLGACGVESDGVLFLANEVVTLDPSLPDANAVYVVDSKIVSVGDADVLKTRYPNAELDITFNDKVLIPGLIDPHVHMIMAALIYSRPFVPPWDMPTPSGMVKGLPTKELLLERLKELDAELKAGEPLIVYGYHNLVQGDLVRQDLDRVSVNRPVFVWHYSGHDFYLNSQALAWAEIKPEMHKEFEGIALDQSGELTGRIFEDATQVLFEKLSWHLLTPSNISKGFEGFESMLAKAGVTTVAELGYGLFNKNLEDIYYFLEYTKADPYHLYLVPEHRAFKKKYGAKSAQKVQSLSAKKASSGTPQVLKQIKFFTDGAFYSQTMRLEQPGYVAGQSKGTVGLWVTESDDLADAIEPYWKLGIDPRIHSNGDQAQNATLDAIDKVRARQANPDRRFVIEHAGLLRPSHLARIASLNGGVSAASHYVYLMGDDYRESIGERVQYMTPLASVSKLSIPVTLHSDAPLAPPYPMQAAAVHMTRETRGGNRSTPSESLSPHQALKAITLDAAWAMGLEDTIGSISVGKRANFTVLEHNPLNVAAKGWPEIKIWGVVLDGKKRPLE